MQSLILQPSAKTAVREQTGAAERPSFRSSMERAEQDAAQAAKGTEEAPKQPEDVLAEEGLNEAVVNEALNGAEETGVEVLEGEEAMEGLLTMIQGAEEDPEQEALELSDLQIGELAAAMIQQYSDQDKQDSTVVEVEQLHGVVQEGHVQEGQVQEQGNIQAVLQQVLQDGEEQAVSRMEPADIKAAATNFENTFAEAQTAAMKADEDIKPQEQNIEKVPEGTQAFVPANQPVSVLELTGVDGEPLPAPEMARSLQDSIFDQIQTAVSTGKQELFIQLKPENLGGLAIHLTMTEEGIKAQVRTSSENIQGLVNAQIVQLEDALKARDIPIVQMEVILDQSASNNFLGQQRQAWQEQSGGNGRTVMMPIEDSVSLYETMLAVAPDDLADGLAEGVEFTA